MKKIAFAAAALLFTTAMPVAAAPVIYTFDATFTGTREGAGTFTTPATFTGVGDTDTATQDYFGLRGLNGFALSSLTAVAGGETFTITSPTTFFAGIGLLGLIFENNGQNGFGFDGPVGYNGQTSLTTTAINTYYPRANFGTDKGRVTIAAITGATFSSQVTAVTAPVPEPATWAMMLVGFGMVGFGMRRRKSNVRTTVRFA